MVWPHTCTLPVVALGALVMALSATASEQRPLQDVARAGNPFTEDFVQFANKTLHEWKTPGLSIAVIDDEDVFTDAYGFSVLPDTPATPETLWYGGSTTKAFAAATLAKFIDSGEYPALSNGWQTTISSIIRDDFVLQDAWSTEHLTLEDAVSHRTGMPRHDGSSFHTIDGRTATVKDIVRNLRHLSLTAPPRTRWMYCNMMFVVLTHVIETIRNQWLGDVLKEEIWEPLGMLGTYFKLEDAERAPQPLAEGYFWDEEEEEYVLIPNMHMNEIGGAGAIFSNVVDYAKWVKCLMHSCDVFSSQAHQAIRSPIMLMAGPSGPKDLTIYGLGWMRTTYYGHVAYEHSGGTDAFSTNVLWFPELKYSVVAFGNTATNAYGAEKVLTHKLLDDKLGIPESDRFDYAAELRRQIKDLEDKVRDGLDNLFPDRPDTPIPPTLAASQLAGTYYDPGYKGFTLREEENPDNSSETILVADRPEMTWRYQLKLRHVSADHWVVYSQPITGTALKSVYAGEFMIGVDGKVASLDIRMEEDMGLYGKDSKEGITSFKRVS